MLTQTAFRLVLITAFVRGASARELLLALLTGARFDAVIATIVVTPSLVLAKLLGRPSWASVARLWVGRAYVVAMVVSSTIDFVFFSEFKTHVDQRVYLLTLAELSPVARTIWTAHHPVIAVASALGLVMMGWRFVGRSWSTPSLEHPTLTTALAWSLFYVVAARGMSIGLSPIRVKSAFVTRHAVLNNTIPSPAAAFWHAIENRVASQQSVSSKEARDALPLWSGQQTRATTLVSDQLRRPARPSASPPPRHVVVVLLEGQHGFFLLPRFRKDNLAPNLTQLAAEGAYFPRFVSAGQQTDNTVAVVVGGLFITGVNLLHDEHASRTWATAMAPQFRRLGYRTRFFYGGSLSWSRLGEFVSAQGFDEVYGGPDVDRPHNAWGVWDEYLFSFALDRIDDSVPSLNVILTTTNHSPFNLDPARLAAFERLGRFDAEDEQTRQVLMHERYVDAQLGMFARSLDRKVPQALFAFTADHVSGSATFEELSIFEQSNVPFVLWGSALPSERRGEFAVAGSQLDVMPTLFGLSAPAGNAYVALGDDLFAQDRSRCAVGYRLQMCADQVLDIASGSLTFAAIRDEPQIGRAPTRQRFDALQTLSRWQLVSE